MTSTCSVLAHVLLGTEGVNDLLGNEPINARCHRTGSDDVTTGDDFLNAFLQRFQSGGACWVLRHGEKVLEILTFEDA
jgi:hypothetical protein